MTLIISLLSIIAKEPEGVISKFKFTIFIFAGALAFLIFKNFIVYKSEYLIIDDGKLIHKVPVALRKKETVILINEIYLIEIDEHSSSMKIYLAREENGDIKKYSLRSLSNMKSDDFEYFRKVLKNTEFKYINQEKTKPNMKLVISALIFAQIIILLKLL